MEENRKPFKLCSQMQLQEFSDKFVIKPTDSECSDLAFSISRSDGGIQTQIDDSCLGTPDNISTIFGVVGTIRLLAGTYVLVITSRKEVGSHLGFPVNRVISMKFLSCNEALKLSTSQEKRDEAHFMSLLRTVETTPGLYYSYETDLTLNLQRTCTVTQGRTSKPLWKQADPRFVWNKNLVEELIENKMDTFVVPLIQGSFQTVKFKVKDSSTKITLISRRCMRRLGTRMWRRGANLEGATANFIETEQILECDGYKSSFLQIRGSIPLLWEQIVDLSYKPRLRIIDHEETPKVVERHFHDLTQRYGEIMVVDLTDKHGDEGQLSAAYAAEMQKLPLIRYVSFDFHHSCGTANFDNLNLLYDQIAADFEKQGYFLNLEGEILLEQKGVIRSNCIDCLDRTNVTQSYLARKSINLQLQRMGLLSSNECISAYSDTYEKFKILWVEHGDEISVEYAGTHALKRDLVRFGKQTVGGLIKDGMSALSRYYLNNFHDGIRQDAMDLISGRYTVNRNSPSPFQLNGFESFSYLPVASALIVGGLTITTFTLNQASTHLLHFSSLAALLFFYFLVSISLFSNSHCSAGRNAPHFVSSVVWAGLTAGVMAVVKANGRQFCSRPRLCGLL